MGSPLNILIAASEIYPFAKTGGLADACGALAKALRNLGHNVRVVLPKYRCVRDSQYDLRKRPERISVPVGPHKVEGEIYEGELAPGVPACFIAQDAYFDRDHLYGPPAGAYYDNAERFIFFSRAVLELCRVTRFRPDIINCNDWQTGLIPVFLKTLFIYDAFFRKTRTVFSIHNLGYQGEFDRTNLTLAHLPFSLFNADGVEFHGDLNFLKSGLVYADLLSTVSETYAREILRPEYAFRLEGVLGKRAANLHGIANGIDYSEWNPTLDPWIIQQFSDDNPAGKKLCKSDLLQQFDLEQDLALPLMCMVTRLTSQKGVDLVMQVIQRNLLEKAQLIVVGVGDPGYEEFFKNRAGHRLGLFLGFDEPLAHRVLAGADFLLMPSVYEPCGLTQMQAMKYGTVPVVSAVGGLEDTVTPYSPETGEGLGFKFSPYGLEFFETALDRALTTYDDQAHWNRLVLNCLRANFSWDRSAREYERIYRIALSH